MYLFTMCCVYMYMYMHIRFNCKQNKCNTYVQYVCVILSYCVRLNQFKGSSVYRSDLFTSLAGWSPMMRGVARQRERGSSHMTTQRTAQSWQTPRHPYPSVVTIVMAKHTLVVASIVTDSVTMAMVDQSKEEDGDCLTLAIPSPLRMMASWRVVSHPR